MVCLQGLAGSRMEAKKIQIKTLFLCLAAVLAVELGTRVVTSKPVYHPMLILGGARLLEILLIVLIVVTWGKRIIFHRLGSIRDGLRFEKGADMVGRLWSDHLHCMYWIVCCLH